MERKLSLLYIFPSQLLYLPLPILYPLLTLLSNCVVRTAISTAGMSRKSRQRAVERRKGLFDKSTSPPPLHNNQPQSTPPCTRCCPSTLFQSLPQRQAGFNSFFTTLTSPPLNGVVTLMDLLVREILMELSKYSNALQLAVTLVTEVKHLLPISNSVNSRGTNAQI